MAALFLSFLTTLTYISLWFLAFLPPLTPRAASVSNHIAAISPTSNASDLVQSAN